MASSKTRLTEDEWLQLKPDIKRMVIGQNTSQKEVIQRLKDDGFAVTKHQLERRLKDWGFRKKATKNKSDDIWQFIDYRVRKRGRQNKLSDVFLNGRLVEPAKLRKEINRHLPTTLVKLQQAGMSPKTPESSDIIIRTPSSTPLRPLWPSCLPWLQFQRRLSLPSTFLQLAGPDSPICIPIKSVTKTPFLPSIPHLLVNSTILNVSRLTADLNSIMPEAYEDENANRANLLLRGQTTNATLERLKLVFYLVSNKVINFGGDSNEWSSIVTFLEDSGVTKMPLQLDKAVDKTLLSVTESLFQGAFRMLQKECPSTNYEERLKIADSFFPNRELHTYHGWDGDTVKKLPSSWRIIDWLLSSGLNPNTRVIDTNKMFTSGGEQPFVSPLHMAVELSIPHLVFLILDGKWAPNMINGIRDDTILTLLIGTISCDDKIRILKRFLEDGASVSFAGGSSLIAALIGLQFDFKTTDLRLLDILIDNGADITGRCSVNSYAKLRWMTRATSALGCASVLLDESMTISCLLHLLGRAQQSTESIPPAKLITSDVVLLAASRGHNRLLELLHQLGVDFTACEGRGTTALHTAAYYGHLKTCQELLKLGIPVDGFVGSPQIPSPLHLAAHRGRLEVVKLLHGHGAELTRSITQDVRIYLGKGRLVSVYRESGTTPIGSAILRGNREICEYLAQKGVPFPLRAAYNEASQYTRRPWLMRLVLSMGADPNWRGDSDFTPLQTVLKPSKYKPELVADAVQMATALLDWGAILMEGEVVQAVLLGDCALIGRLLEIDHFGIGLQHESISIIEAVIADGDQRFISQTLAQYPDTYDAGALCASVFFEDDGLATVKHLLNNCPEREDVLPLESLAIGIAGWRGREDLLDLLLAKFRRPSPFLLRTSMIQIEVELGPNEISSELCYESLNRSLEKARSRRMLFWRNMLSWQKEADLLCSPLTLALRSQNSVSRMLGNGLLPDRLTMNLAAKLKDYVLLTRLAGYPTLLPGFERYVGPLTTAVRERKIDTVKSLLENNYFVDEDNSLVAGGRNPLQMAVENGNLDLVKLLLDAGADVNAPAAQFYGATTLQLAAIHGHLGVAKMLVDLGADVNAPVSSECGRTALEAAAEHGRIDTIQYLLSQGVQTNGRGHYAYLRAIRLAQLEGHLVAEKLLKSWRPWTASDDDLWDELLALGPRDIKYFVQDLHDQSESESESESEQGNRPPGRVYEGDEVQNAILEDAPAWEVHAHEIPNAANSDGLISELEDLEMATGNIFTFWCGS